MGEIKGEGWGLGKVGSNFLDIYILVILVSKQFATFLHIYLNIFSIKVDD